MGLVNQGVYSISCLSIITASTVYKTVFFKSNDADYLYISSRAAPTRLCGVRGYGSFRDQRGRTLAPHWEGSQPYPEVVD